MTHSEYKKRRNEILEKFMYSFTHLDDPMDNNLILFILSALGFLWSVVEIAAGNPFDGFVTSMLSLIVLHLTLERYSDDR